ncbi:MAG: thiamine phosphate synthase [Myxococcales bacterium]|nr:thiamine phosphate synthase [Myxococcales bacterium]
MDRATPSLSPIDPLAFAEALLSAAPLFALQLRAKQWPARRTLALASALAIRCARAGVPFVVNDRPDIASLAGAHAVHVGQDDLSIADVRRAAPQLAVGISTHDFSQLERALASDDPPDYVAFGPVFDTRSKERPDPTVGLHALARASERARAREIPLVAIGGITLTNAREVRDRGASSAALISALATHARDRDALVAHAIALHDALSSTHRA